MTSTWTAPSASNRVPPASLGAFEERRLFRELWSRSRSPLAAQRARARLILANLCLVAPIAERFVTPRSSLHDLLQEGNVALVKAVDRYRPTAKTRFAPFARAIVRRGIERAVLEGPAQPLAIPVADSLAHDDDYERELEAHVGDLLETLTPEEALVVRHRFGIGMQEHHTLSQVARLLGWRTHRVIRVNAQAMN
ncbi:MAG TPA: sigma-70 family RNA polymerase sigma factor, partial [Polyangiaceae bacterium]|nr:sigma-70 family RNA polymerase sigma factor [Polyangiaceae bacterium]